MRALMLEVPQALLDERRRLGHDKHDEMWEGVLHMVPPAGGEHQNLSARLIAVLLPIAERRGLDTLVEAGLFTPGRDDDFKVPDQLYVRPEHRSVRGADGPAELVVEIRSLRDETDEKLPWYGERGVAEVLVVHPSTRRVELFRLRGTVLEPVEPDPDGSVTIEALGVRLETVDGPALALTWDGGSAHL